MTVRLIARPIGDDWPGRPTAERDRQFSRFSATWSDTVELLRREVAMLDADQVVVQLALKPGQLRKIDDWVRADATPAHPGAIVSFDSRHGPLRYATDLFTGNGNYGHLPGWQANIRAIALGLEALRRVDRYGISRSGEQYRGWNELGAGTPMPAAQMTRADAIEILGMATAMLGARDALRDGTLDPHEAWRAAAKFFHPDAGGDPDMFRRLTEARDLLLNRGTP